MRHSSRAAIVLLLWAAINSTAVALECVQFSSAGPSVIAWSDGLYDACGQGMDHIKLLRETGNNYRLPAANRQLQLLPQRRLIDWLHRSR